MLRRFDFTFWFQFRRRVSVPLCFFYLMLAVFTCVSYVNPKRDLLQGGEKTAACSLTVKLHGGSYLKSHHSRLHSVKSSWLRLQALAVVSLGTLVITEVGHGIGDVYCDFADTCCLSLSTRLSAVSVSLCFHSQARWPPALTG